MAATTPWQGVIVAVPTPFRADLSLDHDRLQEHVRWLADEGCQGVTPCGPMGEYRALSDGERADVVRAAVEAAPRGCAVVPGVGGYGSRQSRQWAEQALAAGAQAVLAPPPVGYPAAAAEVVAHYREVAAVGLPVVASHDPGESTVDLTPELLARVAETDGVVAVRETDVSRLHRVRELCPHLDVLVGADNALLELTVCGATGWIGHSPNALPRLCLRLHRLCVTRDLAAALPLYAQLYHLFSWDPQPELVQAVKLAMGLAGRYGGPCRPPRGALSPETEAQLCRDMGRAMRAADG
ncbi:dihydrodipicolinate synthase family protein [Micromonospora soli]|uniref:dihydrodipicolinate synthase family protein n=1 Tax=Micromonospora sp. NBRC 110009 TaxID=3061627 RepID=UPI002672EEEA|nr:dihydrodipicolinate synthase family protein [Micromonospora sp. NBRC 110009]WKT98090.1 dihydrodipicolinate synthase family protein [Micromonospora sp. NBRC 110009]